ncbi:THAP domain-containing protein 9, partial [Aphis craccivora]
MIRNTSLFFIEPDKLHNRYICQEHFPPESFIQNFNQNRLIGTAVPYNYKSDAHPSTSSGFDQNSKSVQEYNILKSKTYTCSKSDIVECRPWTLNEKNLALNLYYKSPTAYKFLRTQKVNLPGPSTIRRWISQSKFLPGFSKLFFSHIQKKFESSDYKEKACTVCFDEMCIKEFIEYSKEFDFIEGFEDLDHYGRTNKSANCVLVFMAQGIYSPWKFSIAYFLAHSGVNKTILKTLIIDVLQKLFEVGLCPKIIVCDQGTNNQSALKSLNISEDNPFF